MPETSPNEVADFFLFHAHDFGDTITNLKLQKLVYYAQAWHLGLYDEPLFDSDFQAWVHGPVNTGLYHRFKQYRWDPIHDNPTLEEIKISEKNQKHLIDVYDVYGRFSAYELEQMTHLEDPWKIARGDKAIDENCSTVIEKSTMQDYYSNLAEQEN